MILALLANLAFAAPGAPVTQPGAAELIPGMAPLCEAKTGDTFETASRVLGKKMRCPVCQGSNISDSPSSTARAMYERTKQLVAAGYCEDQIIDYFIDKYGEFILLEPQSDGLNVMLWIGPGIAVGLGLAFALSAMAGWRKEPGSAPVEKPPPEVTVELDDYERRLLAELER